MPAKEQANNQRTNRLIPYKGKNKTFNQFVRDWGEAKIEKIKEELV